MNGTRTDDPSSEEFDDLRPDYEPDYSKTQPNRFAASDPPVGLPVSLDPAERRERSRASDADGRTRTSLRWFLIWLGIGAIAPLTIMAIGLVFYRQAGSSVVRPPAAVAIEVLTGFELLHVLLGASLLSGRRWLAFGLGIVLGLVTAVSAVNSTMAVTGIWL